MDKLNKIGLNINAVQNDLQKQPKKQEQEEITSTPKEALKPEYQQLDPDKIFDAMKRHGLQNLGQIIASNTPASNSIKDNMDYFIQNITPEKHQQITAKAQEIFKKEFPNVEMKPDLISDVVDNIIFEALAV